MLRMHGVDASQRACTNDGLAVSRQRRSDLLRCMQTRMQARHATYAVSLQRRSVPRACAEHMKSTVPLGSSAGMRIPREAWMQGIAKMPAGNNPGRHISDDHMHC